MTAGISKLRWYAVEYGAGDSPTTPATGEWAVFLRPDGLYVKDDAGTITGPLGTGGGGGAWGSITGTLSDQTDLQAALDNKIAKDGSIPFTGDQSMGGNQLTSVGAPSASDDAATKGYVDTAVTGLLDFKGSTDCSSNPNYPAASQGDAYVVSVAGKIGGASGKSVDVGDVYLAIANNAGGTEASVGTSWIVLEHNLAGALLAANNLSDLANAATARTNLGLAIGTDVQAWDADLDTWATKTPPSGTPVGTTDAQTLSSKTFTNPAETSQALTDGATVSWDANSGAYATITFGGSRTMAAPTNLKAGGVYALKMTQDATGGRLPTWNSVFKNTPLLDLAANAVTLFVWVSDGTNLYFIGGGIIGIPQKSISAAYTTLLTDAGAHLLHPSADTTARTWTIDSNANVAYPIGTAITFINQNGAGVLTIAITSDTMRLAGAGTTGNRTLAANGIATAVKITSTEWIISGTGLT